MVSFQLIQASKLEDTNSEWYSYEPEREKLFRKNKEQRSYELKDEKEWDTFNVSIYGLALRDDLGVEFSRSGAVPRYVIRAGWGLDVRLLSLSLSLSLSLTLYIYLSNSL